MKIFLEAHSGLSAKIVEKSNFNGIWSSSLTNSAIKGLPDTELINGEERISIIRDMRRMSTKPIIVDWDTGGQIGHFPYWVKELEKAGANIIVIEDKAFPKINSLKEGAKHTLEDVDKFCEKIKAGKKVTKDIQIFARLESLIAKKSMYNALLRAEAYLLAGADGILIHSKQKVNATEVMGFAKKFKEKYSNTPLVCVPTTYKLPKEHPFDIVIYANHLLRASLGGMMEFMNNMVEGLVTVQDIFDLTGDKDKCL